MFPFKFLSVSKDSTIPRKFSDLENHQKGLEAGSKGFLGKSSSQGSGQYDLSLRQIINTNEKTMIENSQLEEILKKLNLCVTVKKDQQLSNHTDLCLVFVLLWTSQLYHCFPASRIAVELMFNYKSLRGCLPHPCPVVTTIVFRSTS